MKDTITLNRSVLTSDWFLEPYVAQVFIYLLFVANHAGYHWNCRDIARGSTVTSLRAIAEETKVSEHRAGLVLRYLADNGHIAVERSGNFSIVTIPGFDSLLAGEPDCSAPPSRVADTTPATTAPAEKPGAGDITFADTTFTEMMTDRWNEKCGDVRPRAPKPGRAEFTAMRRFVFMSDNDYGKAYANIAYAIDKLVDCDIKDGPDGSPVTLSRLISEPHLIDYISSRYRESSRR